VSMGSSGLSGIYDHGYEIFIRDVDLSIPSLLVNWMICPTMPPRKFLLDFQCVDDKGGCM